MTHILMLSALSLLTVNAPRNRIDIAGLVLDEMLLFGLLMFTRVNPFTTLRSFTASGNCLGRDASIAVNSNVIAAKPLGKTSRYRIPPVVLCPIGHEDNTVYHLGRWVESSVPRPVHPPQRPPLPPDSGTLTSFKGQLIQPRAHSATKDL
jgi:hypothetical protein